MVSVHIAVKLPNDLIERQEKERGEVQLDYVILGTIRGDSIEGMALLTTAGHSFLDGAAGLYHFDGSRMAPAQNDAFDFFMAETTCSDAPSEAEDSNLDSLLQQIRGPVNTPNQHSLSDVCGVSEGGDGTFDFMCDQSSTQYSQEDVANDSIVNSTSEGLGQSPGPSSTCISQSSPLSTSSRGATAGTHCQSWPSITDDDTDVCSSSQRKTKRKASPGSSPRLRPALPGYQSMTPWTNDIATHSSAASLSPPQEMPCFYLDPQVLQGPRSESRSPQQSPPRLSTTLPIVSTAVTETVDSLPSWQPSLATHTHGRIVGPAVSKGPQRAAAVQQHNREKRFKKTAEALQKCGLWDIAMKTGNLIKRNADLQKEIEALRQEATVFLKSVICNPENQTIVDMMNPAVSEPSLMRTRRMSPTDGGESDTTAMTTTTTSSKISESGCSSTSGYASYTGDCVQRTSPKTKRC